MAYTHNSAFVKGQVLQAESLIAMEDAIINLEDSKQDNLSLKTINGQSLIGSGNISISGTANSNTIAVDDFPSLPYAIYKNTYGYEVEDILSTKSISFTKYYIDTENGSDDNNGLTEGAPFLTLKKALTSASNKDAFITIINDNAQLFFEDIYGNEYAMKGNLVIKANSNATIINGIKTPNFTATSYNNVYQMDYSSYATNLVASNGKYGIVDLRKDNIDAMGAYIPYTVVNSLSDVENTEGSTYVDTSNQILYVHPVDTISTVHPLIQTRGFRYSVRNTTNDTMLYLENLNVIAGFYLSGRPSLDETSTYTTEFIAKNCIFQHNIGGDGVPVSNFNIAYLINCVCAYPSADCYNYHATYLSEKQILNTVFVEVNCQAEEAGYYSYTFNGTRYNMNLTTCHEGVNVLRVNTTGRHGDGPMVADVNGCRSICIDCHVFNNKYNFSGTNVGCYTFNEANAVHSGKATLINCFGQDARITDSNGFYNLYSSVTNTEVKGGNLLDSKYTVTQDLMIKN